MNRFLIIGFEFCQSFHYALVLCKTKIDGAEYRVTVMNGDLEKQLCSNNTIKEVNGCLQVEHPGTNFQSQIKTEVAKALGMVLEKPVREVAMHGL